MLSCKLVVKYWKVFITFGLWFMVQWPIREGTGNLRGGSVCLLLILRKTSQSAVIIPPLGSHLERQISIEQLQHAPALTSSPVLGCPWATRMLQWQRLAKHQLNALWLSEIKAAECKPSVLMHTHKKKKKIICFFLAPLPLDWAAHGIP